MATNPISNNPQVLNNETIKNPPADPTQLKVGDYTTSVILNNIFQLILTMVTALQNAAAAQANRLTVMSDYEQAYTTLASQVPTFIKGGTSGFGQNSDSVRADLNRLNSNIIATVQNRQSVVSDSAKALQSNVNQSNDAVNQQSNLGTAILQELSTLLGSIFK